MAPTGHTYITRPGSAELFPALCRSTGELALPESGTIAARTGVDRYAMMPRRRHTRARNRAKAIAAERRLNDPFVTERNRPPPF